MGKWGRKLKGLRIENKISLNRFSHSRSVQLCEIQIPSITANLEDELQSEFRE